MTNPAPLLANPASPAPEGQKLLDRVRDVIRLKHYSYRTERTYCDWIRRYVRYHRMRHPASLGSEHVTAFLSSLATVREVLKQEISWMEGVTRAKRPRRLPVVLTRAEVTTLLSKMSGTHALMARLMYGTGLRLMECLRLRVKDLELQRHQLIVREGKGSKDRITMFPASLVEEIKVHLAGVRKVYERDRAAGTAGVEPHAYAVKNPRARLRGDGTGSSRKTISPWIRARPSLGAITHTTRPTPGR